MFLGIVLQAADRSLQWESAEGWRSAALPVPSDGKTGFTLLGREQTGVRWTNYLSAAKYTERQNLMNGAGVALGDFDGDGWCDIYLCNREGSNALYRNLGDWRFEDVTAMAGVACTHQISAGATFADINGDGRLDLLVTSFAGPNATFLNLGAGRFTNITEPAGLLSKGGSTSQALGDLDGDGDLDLYVNYFGVEAILRDGGAYSMRTGPDGKPRVIGRYAKRLAIINGRLVEFGEPDILYRNEGNARFVPLEWKDTFRDENGQPMSPPPDFGLAVQIRDIDGDGFSDIYVCNDFGTPDRIWLNDGRGRLRAIDKLALRNMSYASMGADFADIDRDGALDFFTVEMLSRDRVRHLNQSSPMTPSPRIIGAIDDREEVARNGLYWNRGDGTYAELGFYSGLAASDWSWTPIFLDVDLDGFEDVLISNGHMHDVNDRDVTAQRPRLAPDRLREARTILLPYPRLVSPNAAFRNRGDLTFEDAADAWGFNSTEISHGMALGDLDNDGDLDVVVNCVNAPPLIYRNDSIAPRVAVRLKGAAPNTQGIGAKVTLTGGRFKQTQEIICGGRYLSGDDPMRVFAAMPGVDRFQIEVVWRDGKKSVVDGVRPNRIYEIDTANAAEHAPQPGVTTAGAPGAAAQQSLFQEASAVINHRHVEMAYDDFARQPLLPKRLSQLGPGIAWFDLNGDGRDELLVGSGKSGQLAVFRNEGEGKLTRVVLPALSAPCIDDATSILGWSTGDGRRSLILGLSYYESGDSATPAARRFDFVNGNLAAESSIPGSASSTGALAVVDLDGDGDLDFFVGGRMIGGRYPEPATSRLFRNENGKFVPDIDNGAPLQHVGLVSSAVFSDLNGDGWPDLVLACEWGAVRIFLNTQGKLQERTRELGLDEHTGLWTSVTTGDLDGDGRMDIIAGNWGLNNFYSRARAPWFLCYGDFNGDGQVQLLEAYQDPHLKKLVPWRDLELIGTSMPWLREKFASHKTYAEASITEILGTRFEAAKQLRAQTLASTIFFNRPDRFLAVALPSQAQWTPAMGIAVGDLDGDSNEDIFLSQNFFAVRTEDNRQDAGRGLWLRGDGKGQLKAVSAQESGIKIYGEQRGCALGDYDHDGRIDLAVAQNGAATKLYRNFGAKPGLRIRLVGPEGNLDGIGAQVRLVYGEQDFGPAREIQGGGGYWSQNSATVVLGTRGDPIGVWIRWPGGKMMQAAIPPGAREITVNISGEVKMTSSD